jgi:hypothetical protein
MAKPFISKYIEDQVRIWSLVLNFFVQDARRFFAGISSGGTGAPRQVTQDDIPFLAQRLFPWYVNNY